MKKSFNSLRWVVLSFALLFGIFGAWFGWMSFEADRTQWIEAKVKNALNQSMQSLILTLPRIEVRDTNSGAVYFAPNVNDPKNSFDLYGQMLVIINQDTSVPSVKVTLVSMNAEYGASNTTLTSQATVKFPLIVGIEKEIIVRSSILVPNYNSQN